MAFGAESRLKRRGRHAGCTWQHRKADGSMIDVAIFLRQLTYESRPAVLIAADRHHRTQARRSAHRLHGAPRRAHRAAQPHFAAQRMDEMIARPASATVAALPCFASISTISRWSTTRLAIRSATCCCRPSPSRLRADPARAGYRSPGSAATNSPILQADVERTGGSRGLLAQRLLGVIGEPYRPRRPSR